MSVNIFGSSGKHASGVNSNVGLGGVDRNFNQRLIMLSNKLAQKINKSGDTMEGDLKFVYKPESTCNSLSLGVEGLDKNHSMSLLLGNIRNQIYHANGSPVKLLAEHGFEFNCISGQTTKFDHDIVLNNKHVTGLNDPVSSSDAVSKAYSDSKLALAVNDLIRKIYLNAASLENLQTDMLSRIETQRSEINSYVDGKTASLISEQTEILRKIQLNESTIVTLRRETNELVDSTKTSIESEYEQRLTNIRGRQEEIFENLNSYRATQNTFRTRQTELRSLVEANRSMMENLVTRLNMSRYIRNNVGLIPTLNSSANKTGFTVTASHNADTAWKVFNSTPASYWTAGIPPDSEGTYTQLVYLQIKLPVATRIFRIGLRARSDTHKILEWELRGSNDEGIGSRIYNPENMAIGGTARYLDIPGNQPKFTHYRLVIKKVDSIDSYLVYFQLYSLDEVIERSSSDSPESYLEV